MSLDLPTWYFSTWAYLAVLGFGSAVFAVCWWRLKASDTDVEGRFAVLLRNKAPLAV